MYLVDTSVWIDFIRGKATTATKQLLDIFNAGQTVGISPVIFQEVLQGAESEQRFNQFKDYFMGLPFYYPKNAAASYAEAAHIYFMCRRNGLTIRSTIDCLIAQTAIEHQLILLHNDMDFKHIAKIIPALKLSLAH